MERAVALREGVVERIARSRLKEARNLLDLDYESMTVSLRRSRALFLAELKQEAKRRGYRGVTKLRKAELIHLLETGEVLDVASRIEGARVFEPEEVKSISDSFSGKCATRDKAIFFGGLCIGSRVSELCQYPTVPKPSLDFTLCHIFWR